MQPKPDAEDATCSCTDAYGCGHGTNKCGKPLSEPPQGMRGPAKCHDCWLKDNEHWDEENTYRADNLKDASIQKPPRAPRQ